MGWYWFLWLLIGFGIPEGIAIGRHKTQDTLSGTVWRWFDVVPGSTIAQWTILRVILAGLMIWLSVHFVFGAWRQL